MSDDRLRISPKNLRGEDGYRTFSVRIVTVILTGALCFPVYPCIGS